MRHLSELELTSVYYGEADSFSADHLRQCSACRSEFDRMKGLLDMLRETPTPVRGDNYEVEVWRRLMPRLPEVKRRGAWLRWWMFSPVAAALLIVVFWAGMVTQQRGGLPGISPKSRDRVLLITMGDHLDRSQILLAELANGLPESGDLTGDREAARQLLSENRLLRTAADRSGNGSEAALLDELERVLLDIANEPSGASASEVQALLFKIRIVSSNVRKQVQEI